jgi:hypothetical protein
LRDAIESCDWLAEILHEDAGLTASGNWIRELVKRSWRGAETDMVICAAADLSKLTAALRAVGHRPRLLVALTEETSPDRQFRLANHKLPAGTSLLLLPFGGPLGRPGDAIVELMREFAHDLPLFEFGRHVDRDDWAGRRPSMLFSRPEWLDALRLSDALDSLKGEALSLTSTATEAGVAKFLNTGKTTLLRRALRVDQPRSIELKDTLGRSGGMASVDFGGAFFDNAIGAIESFTHESDGLVPMANLRKALVAERNAEAQVKSAAAEALRDPEVRDTYMEQQARTVDVTVRGLNADGSAGRFVEMREALVARARYRIQVQVGRRSVVSIVSGDVPPIDLLLPPPERGRHHVLHVALYTDDFSLGSPILQRLELPEVGASPPVHFDVVTLSGGRSAQARIAVYYDLPPEAPDGEMRNHLIQTFLLKAHVRESEDQPAEEGIAVVLEFSLNARFNQLPRLQSRLISLACNDGPGPASHMLMMKRGTDALPVKFTDMQISASLKSIRDTFEWASSNDASSGPRFPADQDQGVPADFDRVIARVARAGRFLYRELLGGALGTPLGVALTAAAHDHDKLIQVTLLVRNFAFPWTSIYDFDLPTELAGAPDPMICKGFQRKQPDGTPFSCGDCLGQCLFPDKTKAVCVYGFWGMRHQIEQLVADKNEAPLELRPVGPGAVAFSMGLDGRFLDEIPHDLEQKLGTFARRIADNEDVLPTLWSDQRPAVLLLVGHYRVKDVDGEPVGPRLTLSAQRFLRPDDIIRQYSANPENWRDPRSVILLAACSGGVVDIGSVQNFVNLFMGVGAGAVIGPEAIIYEGVARRFAVEMSGALVNGTSVGVAILEFRRRLLQNLNPLGLMFTAYGFADLATSSSRH